MNEIQPDTAHYTLASVLLLALGAIARFLHMDNKDKKEAESNTNAFNIKLDKMVEVLTKLDKDVNEQKRVFEYELKLITQAVNSKDARMDRIEADFENNLREMKESIKRLEDKVDTLEGERRFQSGIRVGEKHNGG